MTQPRFSRQVLGVGGRNRRTLSGRPGPRGRSAPELHGPKLHGRGIARRSPRGRLPIDLVQDLDVATMPATIAHHGPGCRSTWCRTSTWPPCRRRSLTTARSCTAAGSPDVHHAAGDGQHQGHGRGRLPIDLVQDLDVATMPATIAHHGPGCRAKWTRATAGKILDADRATRFTTRPAADRPGAGPRRCSPCRRRSLTTARSCTAAVPSVQALDVAAVWK